MFDISKLTPVYQNLIGWRQHFDPSDISISAGLQASDSGEFYQSKHPAMRLDKIRATLPNGFTLEDYLVERVQDSIAEMFNDVLQRRLNEGFGKSLLDNAILLNKRGWQNDGIVNQDRFVGFQIRLKAASALRVAIKEIGLQFQGVESFDLYLFHSSKSAAIATIPVSTPGSNAWKWEVEEQILNSFESGEFHGGVFVLGYYQEDLTGMAINYSNFDWNKGECGGCNASRYNTWNNVQKYFHIFPLYVPDGQFVKGEMFELQKAFFTPSQSWGLNLKLTVDCDMTQFFIDNKMHFKNLLGLKVVHKILYDMKHSVQTNYIEEQLKMMIIRDLEGDKETNYLNITQQYNREIKAVKFNTSAINSLCLPCDDVATVPTIGSM